jgi:Tfp pilus assembly protein PilX
MSERGVALILVLLVMMTLSALSMSLAVMVSTESRVAANYRDGIESVVRRGGRARTGAAGPGGGARSERRTRPASPSPRSLTVPAGLRRLPDGTFTICAR